MRRLRLLRPFRTLRWKLTLWAIAAMLSTVGVLTVVAVVSLSFADRRLMRGVDMRAPLHAEMISLAARVRPLLERPDRSAIIEGWLAAHSGVCSRGLMADVAAGGGEPGQVRVALSQLSVADRQGRLLAALPAPTVRDLVDSVPDVAVPIVQAALAGERDPRSLALERDAAGVIHLAAPVRGLAGEVVGVVYAEADSGPLGVSVLTARIARLLPRNMLQVAPIAVAVAALLAGVTGRRLLARLARLGRVSRAWARGDFTQAVGDTAGDELGDLGRSLDEMARDLGGLLDTRDRLATLEERNRLARELHDTVKQHVFSLSMLLGSVDSLLESSPEQARQRLGDARRTAQDVASELVALIEELRPAILGRSGLADALERYATTWSRGHAIAAQVVATEARRRPNLAPEIERELLRVAQEALANVGRHSHAHHVAVHLDVEAGSPGSDGDGRVRLTVRDDGVGFDLSRPKRAGFGLTSMASRMRSLRGELTVASERGRGTTVVAECPVVAR